MSRGPPQLMFDDGSRVMVEDSENMVAILGGGDEKSSSNSLPPTQRGSIPLHTYYEIDRLSREVMDLLVTGAPNNENHDILRVALQFPDELLEDSPEVCWLLEDKIREDLETSSIPTKANVPTPFCFVLGDTTVNSCCPDEVAALHLNADVLIHYGHACLSPTESLPVLYSFGKVDFEDLDGAVEALEEARHKRSSSGEKKDADTDAFHNNYLVLYQVGYHHAMENLRERWMNHDGSGGSNHLNVVTAELPALTRLQNQRPKRKSAGTTRATSCCQQSEESAETATGVGDSSGGGGCCGGNAAIVLPQDNPTKVSSSSCCQTEDNASCNVPISLPSAPENITSETESGNGVKSRPLVVGGLELPAEKISSWEDLANYTVVFIMGNPEEDADNYSTDDKTTPQQRQYANSMLCFLSLPHGEPKGGYWIYSPRHKTLRTDVSPPPALSRQLKRRFFLTQKARDASVFGILVSNLSQQHLVDVVQSLQTIIRDADRTAYSFAVGKINPAKLANFAEIECFVMVACREHSLLDHEREYPIPVITPMELEIALENLQWGMQAYSLDCQDVKLRLEEEERARNERLGAGGGANEVTDNENDDAESVDSDAPYFSMVTGKYESRKQKGHRNDDLDLQALPGKGQVTEYKSEASNFLRQREYQGLESKVGQTEIKVAVQGMRGIASDYRNEPNDKQ